MLAGIGKERTLTTAGDSHRHNHSAIKRSLISRTITTIRRHRHGCEAFLNRLAVEPVQEPLSRADDTSALLPLVKLAQVLRDLIDEPEHVFFGVRVLDLGNVDAKHGSSLLSLLLITQLLDGRLHVVVGVCMRFFAHSAEDAPGELTPLSPAEVRLVELGLEHKCRERVV